MFTLKSSGLGRGLMAAFGIAALSAMFLLPTASASAAYPDKPITVVVGWGPGGGIDTYGHL